MGADYYRRWDHGGRPGGVIIITIDPELVRRAARQLTAGVNAPNGELADARIYRVIRWGARSPRNVDVVFAAVQMLRDLGTVDRAEAAYLFSELLDHRWDVMGNSDEPDPNLVRALQDGVDADLIAASMHDQKLARTVADYRDRGEEDLAVMVSNGLEEYGLLCADGQISLLDEKPPRETLKPEVKRAAVPSRLAERVLALSATETIGEWHAAWLELCGAMRDTDPSTGVPAIQNLRELGGITFEESLVLIDMAIGREVGDVLAADREYYRLQRAIDEFDRLNNISYDADVADEARPVGWQMLRQRSIRRINGQTAVVLRRYGEHRLANLLLAKPDEYARIRDELQIGSAWGE